MSGHVGEHDMARSSDSTDRLARRWAVGLLMGDVVALPALFWATPWHWPSVLLVWAGAVGLLLVLGVVHHHARTTRARAFAERQERLRAQARLVPTTASSPVTPPPAAPRTGLAF